ncbi:MAG TPA: SAF domain-containing protein [Longilinea sp.]|nr:SAF domain-containing protein [Longilinea sp.]
MASAGRRRGTIIILIAVILILIVGAVYIYLNVFNKPAQPVAQNLPAPTQVTTMVNIVITTQAIQRGTVLTESVLTTIPYPQTDLVAGTFVTDMSQIVGKRARYDLDARIPLTPSMVVDQPQGSTASFQIPSGMTAFTIPIQRLTDVAYAPQTGDHVMVIGCLLLTDLDVNFQTRLPNLTASVLSPGTASGTSVTATISTTGLDSTQGRTEMDQNLNLPVYVVPSESTPRPRVVCQTVISDATVLQVGDFPSGETLPAAGTSTEPTPTPTEQVTATSTGVSTGPEVMTLIVSPQDAVILNYLITVNAQLTLALRGAGDLQSITTQAVSLQFVMDQKNIQLPAKLPYGIEPRIDSLKYQCSDIANCGDK